MDMIIAVNKERRISEFNKAAEDSFGYKREEVLGKEVNLLYADPEEGTKIHTMTLEQDRCVHEILNKRKTGELFTSTLSASVLRDLHGELVGVMGISRDISERKRAEEELSKSEEKYRSIFENVQDVYYESSIDGTVLEVSPSIEIFSRGQYHRDDLIGKSIYDFYSDPGDRKAFVAALQTRGRVSDFEITLKNRDDSWIPCSISAMIYIDDQERPGKIIGSLRDITERKRAEGSILEKVAELQRWQDLMLDRQDRTQELKREVNKLCGRAGETLRYPSVGDSPANSEVGRPNL